MARNTSLSNEEKTEIINLYQSGMSYEELKKATGHATATIAKQVKGLRTSRESKDLSRSKGNMIVSDETRAKLSIAAKKSVLNSKNKIWTKPEQGFKTILNELDYGVKFSDDVKFIFGLKDDNNPTVYFQYPLQRYVCDFVDIENKIVFLVNGDFWHANPLLYAEDKLTKIQKHNKWHDRNRRAYLESKGFQVIEIWESEIYWNKDLVKDKIRATRKLVNPSVLHAELAGSDPQVAHLDWSERVRDLWFKKPKGRPKKQVEKTCKVCGNCFTAKGQKQLDNRQYCSSICSHKALIKVIHPTKEQLQSDIESLSWLAIGRKYGVSDNAVRKWAKGYGILLNSREVQ